MKKLTKLLVLSGLAVSLLTGCTINGKGGKGDEPEQPEVVKTLESIKVSAQPTKTSYLQGEAFDAAGLEVKAVYNTGEEVLAATAYTLSGFDSSTAGPKTVTVTFEGKTATFEVNVIGKNGLSITAPTQKRYVVGDQLSLAGLVVYQVYADGTKVALTANDYQVSGFSSQEAGPVTVTITAGGDTATFVVNVYAADWSAAEKTLMGDALLYEIPYFIGLEAYQNGKESIISTEEDPDYDFLWVEASSAYDDADEDDVDAYADMIEEIVVLDGEGNPVLDDGETIQAWNSYALGQGRKYSDDVEELGFDTKGPVYQYARWYADNSDYYAYQVLTVGLSKDSKLLIASTITSVGYASDFMGQPSPYYLAGNTTQSGEWDNWNNYFLPVMEEIESHAYGAPSTASYFSQIAFPTIVKRTDDFDGGTLLLIATNSCVTSPYEHSYYYGDADSDFELIFVNTDPDGVVAYTDADLTAMLSVYDASQITAEEDGSKTVAIDADGLEIYVNYYISQSSGYLWIDIDFGEFNVEKPIHALGAIYDELATGKYYVVSGTKLVSIEGQYSRIDGYNFIFNYLPDGSMAVSTSLYAPTLKLDQLKADLQHACSEAGLIGDNEALVWEDSYVKSTPAGTLKVGTGEAQDITLTLDEDATTAEAIVLEFTLGDDAYVATYTVATKVLALTKNGADYKTFAATEAENYATTWTVGEGEDLVELTISAVVEDVFDESSTSFTYYCEEAGQSIKVSIFIFENSGFLAVQLMAQQKFYFPTEDIASLLGLFVELEENEELDAVVGIPAMLDSGLTNLSINADKMEDLGAFTVDATYVADAYNAIKAHYASFLTGLTPHEVDGLGTLYVSEHSHYGLMFSFDDETCTVSVDYFIAPAVDAILNPTALA